MPWPNPDEEPAVKTIGLSKYTASEREAICLARESEAKVGAGVWMWWTDRSHCDDSRVGVTAVCKLRDR